MPPPEPVTMATLFSNRMSPFPPSGHLVHVDRENPCLAWPLASHRGGDDLRLEVFLEPGQAHLPAVTGLLVSTERRVGGVPDAAVDIDRADPQPRRHPGRPLRISAEHRAG